jgi:hypothetical protein
LRSVLGVRQGLPANSKEDFEGLAKGSIAQLSAPTTFAPKIFSLLGGAPPLIGLFASLFQRYGRKAAKSALFALSRKREAEDPPLPQRGADNEAQSATVFVNAGLFELHHLEVVQSLEDMSVGGYGAHLLSPNLSPNSSVVVWRGPSEADVRTRSVGASLHTQSAGITRYFLAIGVD